MVVYYDGKQEKILRILCRQDTRFNCYYNRGCISGSRKYAIDWHFVFGYRSHIFKTEYWSKWADILAYCHGRWNNIDIINAVYPFVQYPRSIFVDAFAFTGPTFGWRDLSSMYNQNGSTGWARDQLGHGYARYLRHDNRLAWSPSSYRNHLALASVARDGTLQIWDLSSFASGAY